MQISLSVQVLATTAHSLAAFHALGCPEEQRTQLSPLLAPGKEGLFKSAVRQAFAHTALELVPWLADCRLNSETAVSDPGYMQPDTMTEPPDILGLDVVVPASFPTSAGWALRRHLENTVAMKALALLTAADAELSAIFEETAEKSFRQFFSLLGQSSAPFVRSGLY